MQQLSPIDFINQSQPLTSKLCQITNLKRTALTDYRKVNSFQDYAICTQDLCPQEFFELNKYCITLYCTIHFGQLYNVQSLQRFLKTRQSSDFLNLNVL